MHWPDERYVRIYTRDTPELVVLDWQARLTLWELLRKVDRAGIIDLGGHGATGLAALLRVPVAVAELSLDAWLAAGIVEQHGSTLVLRNFIEAQEAASSDKQRARTHRERKRAHARRELVTNRDESARPDHEAADEPDPTPPPTRRRRAKRDEAVTERDATVTGHDATVTTGHSASPRAVPYRTVPDPPTPTTKGKRRQRAHARPATWRPSETATTRAAEYGLDLADELASFDEWTTAKGATYVDWDAAFLSHLRRRRSTDPRDSRAPARPRARPGFRNDAPTRGQA